MFDPTKFSRLLLILLSFLFHGTSVFSQSKITPSELRKKFTAPPPEASPWVFWYWVQASVSKEGITADLQAMKEVGIGGAYLMPVKAPTNPPLMDSTVLPMTPSWWRMVCHAMTEAKRLGIKLAFHVSDGFALAGGPWITPELSMQKVAWIQKNINGGQKINLALDQPETIQDYYKDIAVFAFPSPEGTGISTKTVKPIITSSKQDSAAQFLTQPGNKRSFNCDEQCWVQYSFDQPFTCRTIVIQSRNNYQANRLIVEVSDDGKTFKSLGRLEAPRHGWQDWDSDYTHVIPATTAKFFRFTFDKRGSEGGAEDLDAAKWKPSLKVTGIELLSEPRIHQYEGKNGEVWRVSKRTTKEQLPDEFCIPKNSLINITDKLSKDGQLEWNAPAGDWTIIRIGHTSTGHRNETASAAIGLECDKFNPKAIKLQFDNWFGETIKQAGPQLTSEVLKIFHVDSWECGSQNWSTTFREEFRKRRGYDPINYLPVMAGIPVESADVSERFLYDVRQTIAELINDVFYVTLKNLAHGKGVAFSAESVAPTMVSDGMLHYQNVDVPMGEFWLRSPTHDKPNDMMDAITGAHIYGKNIVQSESFTELRMQWDEHPGMLKSIGDRNYALGINRFVFHVFNQNPWLDRKPGMTLDDVGLYFQRDQTWWKQSKAWMDYVKRCQALLQIGKPVADIAVFTGEEIPRRSVLPERLISSIPGIIGEKRVAEEKKRLQNEGQPLRTKPSGVTHSANMADPEKWVDPLRGYAYDSYNKDALIKLSTVKNGRIELPGGASYGALVIPGSHVMLPDADIMSQEVAQKLKELVANGATVLLHEKPNRTPGLQTYQKKDREVQDIAQLFWNNKTTSSGKQSFADVVTIGKGRIIKGAFMNNTFDELGLERDLISLQQGIEAEEIAWTHRTAPGLDIYFISNQMDKERVLDFSLRVNGRVPELWDPVSGNITTANKWRAEKGRTIMPIKLAPSGSLFIVFQSPTEKQIENNGKNWMETKSIKTIEGSWSVTFNPKYKAPSKTIIFNELQDWSKHSDSAIRYYSGTATYQKTFDWKKLNDDHVWLNLGKIANIAEVKVNGINCGILWTAPYQADITKALKEGTNQLTIEVTNTWANSLIGDLKLPKEKRFTNTTAPLRPLQMKNGNTLLEAGLLGPVTIQLNSK